MVLLGFEAVPVSTFPLLCQVEIMENWDQLQTIEHANDDFSHIELEPVMSSHIFSLCAHLICLIKFIYMLPFFLLLPLFASWFISLWKIIYGKLIISSLRAAKNEAVLARARQVASFVWNILSKITEIFVAKWSIFQFSASKIKFLELET